MVKSHIPFHSSPFNLHSSIHWFTVDRHGLTPSRLQESGLSSVLVTAGQFEELEVSAGVRRQFSEVDQPVAKAEEQVVGGLVFESCEKVVSQYEIIFRVGSLPRPWKFPAASAHSDSEGEFDSVSEVDFSPAREVKAKKLGIPGEAHGDGTERIRFQVAPGIGKLKISEKGIPCSSDPKAG